ncbi:unnamed protein product, partial [Mesorhabditis belari]|uniref:Intraflagellar transport 43 n=1 Tax=Mesorhabditis belari TaxID=2138241 RepID=A0AAF3EZ74_9BILA
MTENGIDSKPKIRGYSARGRRKALESSQELAATQGVRAPGGDIPDELNDLEANDLNIRVKDRGSEEAPKKGRTGALFKGSLTEPQGSGIKSLFNKEAAAGAASELKETIKRPLSGLFRRPGSRAGGRKDEDKDDKDQIPQVEDKGATQGNNSNERFEFTNTSRRHSQAPIVNSDWEATAKAPHLPKQQFHSVFQIDALGAKHPHLSKMDDIDISLLMRYTCLEDEVHDEESPWNWDYLFATICAEMKEEWGIGGHGGGEADGEFLADELPR